MVDTDRSRAFAVEVVRRLHSAGHVAYWAGGCVRDQLLRKVPHDYDVATNALPEKIRDIFGRAKTLAIGAAFGVISVLGPRGVGQVDVATFRRDAAYSDGRHPDSVTFSTAEEDAQRRDFTINGLFYDPLADRVIDYVGGQEDLQLGIVRAIRDPVQRFDEDKLRMLRAVRFTATLGFQLDPPTLAAIQQLRGELIIVSAERIAGEMERLLVNGNRRRGVELLCESGLLDVVIPETATLTNGDPDAWLRTLSILERLHEPSFGMVIAALIRECPPEHDVSTSHSVCARWRLSTEVTRQVAWLLSQEEVVRRASQQPWPKMQRVLVSPMIDELLDYSQAVAEVLDRSASEIEFCRERLAWPPGRLNPPPLVNGDDLIAAGLTPGPRFREILERVRDAQLDSRIASSDDGLRLAQQLAQSGPEP